MPRLKFALLVLCLSPILSHRLVSQTFTLSASVPITVTQGSSGTSVISVTPSGGFAAPVTFSASGLPVGATAAFSTSPLATPYTNGTTLTITTTPATPAAITPVTVTGTSGGVTVSVPVNLTVQSPAAAQSASTSLKNDFGFGVALGLSVNVLGPDIVNNATIDANGIVRVNTRANATAGFMLESHYYVYPRPKPTVITGTDVDDRTWGMGPFVAAQPGSAQIISAVGAGWMVGFRRPKGTTPSGFGLGFGYESIPAAQVLGSEFVNGQKAPVDANGSPLPIRYETQDKGSVLVVLSVTF